MSVVPAKVPHEEPPEPAYAALVRELKIAQKALRRAETLAVELVREAGGKWQEIADELGVARPSAREKYVGRPPRKRGKPKGDAEDST